MCWPDRTVAVQEAEFEAIGSATSFQCQLKAANKSAKFTPCRSPERYTRLRLGRYSFEVRALGAGGPDPSPARKTFAIS
jgi:hypothetical protein